MTGWSSRKPEILPTAAAVLSRIGRQKHHRRRLCSIIKLSWRLSQIKRWTASYPRCETSFRRQILATPFHSHFCFSKLGSWRSKSRSSNPTRKAWMRLLTMFCTRMRLVLVVRPTWDSKYSMRTAPCCSKWWLRWHSNSMRWKSCMRIRNPHQVRLAPKSTNSKKYSQCKEIFICVQVRQALACTRANSRWI
jgi:hypothetical protein